MSIGAVGEINGGISSIKFLNARQAFENTKKLSENNAIAKNGFSEEDVKLSISSQNININNLEETKNTENTEHNPEIIKEIKNFMEKNKIINIEENDLKHALTYGTSLLADYTA